MSLLLKKKLKMQNEKSKLRNSTIFNFLTCGDSPRQKFLIFNSSIDGFTLIEVLLSLVLLTIILGAVYSSFFTVQRALERFDGVSLKYHEVRTTLDIIRREIEGAFFTKYNEQNIENKTHFIIEDRDIFGKPTSRMSLTAFSFKGSLNTVSYSVEERDGTFDLVKTETITVSPIKGYSVQMIEGIEGFTVETLFNDKWVKTWDTLQTGSIPDTVRVSITFDDKGGKITLTEYARPKVGKQL
ncbi:MAG: prepilin-type N-terminal cleavage/methylation domain-containing protein [Nitrospirae bacterium]|nr:prepilin-type N-terminal cleavage/methylation domain-containing protein [Nitrospirota bacterium]